VPDPGPELSDPPEPGPELLDPGPELSSSYAGVARAALGAGDDIARGLAVAVGSGGGAAGVAVAVVRGRGVAVGLRAKEDRHDPAG
jgi:hypothetical protein